MDGTAKLGEATNVSDSPLPFPCLWSFVSGGLSGCREIKQQRYPPICPECRLPSGVCAKLFRCHLFDGKLLEQFRRTCNIGTLLSKTREEFETKWQNLPPNSVFLDFFGSNARAPYARRSINSIAHQADMNLKGFGNDRNVYQNWHLGQDNVESIEKKHLHFGKIGKEVRQIIWRRQRARDTPKGSIYNF